MKAALIVPALLAQSSGVQAPSEQVRLMYAKQLFLDILASRLLQNQLEPTLTVAIAGKRHEILYIQDDSAACKQLYDHLSGDDETRSGLLKLGFKVVVLVNHGHGTFVLDLMTDGLNKPELRDC